MIKGKLLILLLIVLLLFTAVAGCSSQYTSDNQKADTSYEAPGYASTPDWYPEPESGGSNDYDDAYGRENPAYDRLSTGQPPASNDKIIYYYNAGIETLHFDETLKDIDLLIEKFNAFIESSSVTGSKYGTYDYSRSYRTAAFVIRVPKESYKLMVDEVALLGNLVNGSMQAQNITSQFFDTQSRLNTYRVEESRLLSMLEKAETVTDMITIETRLSEVRYNIESLTTMLNNWTMQIDYSTINLNISEVKELTPEVTIPRTLGEEIADALSKTFRGLVVFFRNLLIVFIAALPVFIIIAVILLIVIVLVKIGSKRKRKKLAELHLRHTQNPVNDQERN